MPITGERLTNRRAYKRQFTVLNANNFQSLLRYYFQSFTSSSESLGDSSPSASAIPHLASDRSTVSFGTTRPRLSKTGGGICRQICNFISFQRYLFKIKTRNNQRLQSAGDNDRRSQCLCSNAVMWVSFWQMTKRRVIRLQGVKGRNARDQIAFWAFHSFLVEV